MSSFSWLDNSERDRRKALEVIEQFREKDTRDELGVGTVRDSLADLLFPGTSTLMTRARYYLFVPWTYLKLEQNRRIGSADVVKRARREEVELIEVLRQAKDHDGLIGRVAGAKLKYLPSWIYWTGLGRLGIRLSSGSWDQYHRSFDRLHASVEPVLRTDDGDPVQGALPRNWHPAIPRRPEDFPKGATFQLTHLEADFLRERIITRAPDTLFAFLVDQGHSAEGARFPWAHPHYETFPKELKDLLVHARNFSEIMNGAALLYNRMLAERATNEEWTASYADDMDQWFAEIGHRAVDLANWDLRGRFWEVVDPTHSHVSFPTRLFVERWTQLVLSGKDIDSLMNSTPARTLLHERERAVKGTQARLDNRRALELWRGAAGTSQLDYRWTASARAIITDILDGLRR